MKASLRLSRMRTGLAAMVLGFGLVTGPFLAHRAAAQFTWCRSDPALVLSNGAVLDLDADIYDGLLDVRKVVYVVHAPVGTHLIALVNTDGLMGLKESVQFYANDAANTYDTSTTVYTGQTSVRVTATSAVVSALGLTVGAGSSSGVSWQALRIHFTSLL